MEKRMVSSPLLPTVNDLSHTTAVFHYSWAYSSYKMILLENMA